MIRKKNYKKQQHFSQLYSFTVYSPDSGSKYTIYFKRYRADNNQKKQANVYNIINNKQAQPEQPKQSEYPKDRTLELMSFDGNLGFIKKFLRKIGKIRKMDLGQGIYKDMKIWTAMVVFKFQFDLVKCFRDDYLQQIMNQQSLSIVTKIKEEDKEQSRCNLIHQHMGQQLSQKLHKLQKMKDGGFQVVTDIYGQYRFDYQANQQWVKDLPQSKRNKKKQQKRRAQNINQKQ